MKKNWKNTLLIGFASLLPFSAFASETAVAEQKQVEVAIPENEKPQAQASIPLPINRITKHMADIRSQIQELSQNNADVLAEYDNLTTLLKNAYLDNRTINEGDVHIILEAIGFSAESHNGQARKNAAKTPYIIHPISVTEHLITIGGVYDRDILVAALLHDTVEDTKTTFVDINRAFGTNVEAYVKEVTDDKSLPKAERKKLQIATAPKKSKGAAQIKLADKYDNLKCLTLTPPTDWDQKRIDEYFAWAEQVVSALPDANQDLKKATLDSIAKHPQSALADSQVAK